MNPTYDFAGQVALVTGASSGMGLATAQAFCAAGASVVLADIEGLSYEEVAEVLGLKLGTVRSRLHRARAQLRRHLEHRAPRPPRPTLRPGAGRIVPLTG